MRYRQYCLLLNCHRLYPRLRTTCNEGRQIMLELLLLGLVTVSLLVYLVYALLQPERF